MTLEPKGHLRNYKFALMLLADVMFQLLFFFTQSASLTPYSLLSSLKRL